VGELKINNTLANQVATMYKRIPIRKLLQAADLAANKDLSAWKEFLDEFEN
jgi:hypothetical protein